MNSGTNTLKSRIEAIVAEMVECGILFEDARAEFERHFIAAVLARNDGNLSRTADELRIHRNTLSKRIRKAPKKAPKRRR